jgi:hypothetical protein
MKITINENERSFEINLTAETLAEDSQLVRLGLQSPNVSAYAGDSNLTAEVRIPRRSPIRRTYFVSVP